MKTLLVALVFAAFLALACGSRRGGCCGGGGGGGGCCGGDDQPPRCGGGRRYDGDSGYGCGGYSRRENEGCGGRGRGGRDDDDDDDHVYRFQIGENFGAYEYLDENGYLQGFYIDLLQAVCKKAGKTCSYMLDTYEHCWKTTGEREYPGVGLLDGYYDGCLGMLPSPDRLNSFNFTSAFTPNVKAALHWREKDDVGDRHNLTGRKIGFIEGWAVSQRCLRRQYNITGTDKFEALTFSTHEQLVDSLLQKKVDAIVTVDVFDSKKLGIVPEEPWFECTIRGLSVMTPYYSDVIGWWNCAFARLQRSGEFKELCVESQEKHGYRGNIRCI